MASLRKAFESYFKIGGMVDPSLSKACSDAVAVVNRFNRQAKNSMRDFQKSLDNVSTSWDRLSRSISSTYIPLRNIALGIAGAGAGIYALGVSTAERARDVHLTAGKYNMTTEEVGGLVYAAEQFGMNAKSIDTSIRFLNKSIRRYIEGNEDYRHLFNNVLKVNPLDESGQRRRLFDILMDLPDMFKINEDNEHSLTVAGLMFGSPTGAGGNAVELLPLLELGRSGILKLIEEAKRIGFAPSAEEAEAGAEFMESYVKLKSDIMGTIFTIGSMLWTPLERFNEGVQGLLDKYKDSIFAKIQVACDYLLENMPAIIEGFERIGKMVWNFFIALDEVVQEHGGWKKVLTDIFKLWATWKGSEILYGILQLVAAIVSIFASTKIISGGSGLFKLSFWQFMLYLVGKLFWLIVKLVKWICIPIYSLYKFLKVVVLWQWIPALIAKIGVMFTKLWGVIVICGKAIGAFFAGITAPVWGIIALIAVIVAGAIYFRKELMSGLPVLGRAFVALGITIWGGIKALAKLTWHLVSQTIVGLLKLAYNMFRSFLGIIWGVFKIICAVIKGDWAGAIEIMNATWKEFIKNPFADGVNWASGFLDGVLSIFTNMGGIVNKAWQGIIKTGVGSSFVKEGDEWVDKRTGKKLSNAEFQQYINRGVTPIETVTRPALGFKVPTLPATPQTAGVATTASMIAELNKEIGSLSELLSTINKDNKEMDDILSELNKEMESFTKGLNVSPTSINPVVSLGFKPTTTSAPLQLPNSNAGSGDGSNVGGNNFTFSPTIQITGVTDSGNIKAQVESALKDCKPVFEQWLRELQHHNSRVSLSMT